MSNSKLIEYQEWVSKVEDAGFNLLVYTVPCCGNELKTIAPETKGVMWDSLAFCPHCGQGFVKYAYFDHVKVTLVNHPTTQLKTA